MKLTPLKNIRFPLIALAAMHIGIPTAQALEAEEIFKRVQDSVMVVRVYDEKDNPLGQGSAVLVAPENLLTNCHVLAKSKRIEIRHENVSYGAELVHIDLERDLCQIRAKNYRAKPVEIGNSDTVRVGKKVYALGNPRGLELSLSDGLVSALRKDKHEVLQFIQTTAPISPGSSGGGLFDADGKLIGITTLQRVDSQNLNFAIPINMYRDLPERSRLALAKAAEKKAAAQTSANSTQAANQQEKPLLGQDLRDHFSTNRNVSAMMTSVGGDINISLRTSSNGQINLSAPKKNGSTVRIVSGEMGKYGGAALTDGYGKWYLKSSDQMCIDIYSSGGFMALYGCYRVFARESKQYVWRSVQESTTVRYTDE